MLKTLSHAVLSLVYPRECDVCHVELASPYDGAACSACWSKTRIFTGKETLCKKCGAFLFGPSVFTETRCRKCDDYHFDLAIAVGIYEYALAASVLRLKRVPHLARRLKELIKLRVDLHPLPEKLTVMPVPLSPRRRRERGFNQAELMAKFIASHINAKIDVHSLARDLDTPMHRAGMDRKARAMSVKGAFRIARPKLVDGRNILLVDDVMTSGSTASVCAQVLKNSGAATVSILTIARAA